MFGFFKKETTQDLQIELPEDVILKKNARARKMTLRHKESAQHFLLTVPPYVSKRAILSFVEKNYFWLEQQRMRMQKKDSFTDGLIFYLCGRETRIVHASTNPRGKTTLENDILTVHGDPELINTRVVRFLKQHAAVCYEPRLRYYGEKIGKMHTKLFIKDMHSRWGSCSSLREITLSWRLLLAPYSVMDYVIAHEVAHMNHMDHGADFWSLCEEIMPETNQAKKWLKKNGYRLHLLG